MAVILPFSCYPAQLQLPRLYHPSSMVEAVGCHVLSAVTLVLRSDYTLCSSVTPACPARNVLPVRVPRALPLLLQTPLWSMTCHAKSAALCCGEYLDCRIVSFRPYFFFCEAEQVERHCGYTICCTLHARTGNVNHPWTTARTWNGMNEIVYLLSFRRHVLPHK